MNVAMPAEERELKLLCGDGFSQDALLGLVATQVREVQAQAPARLHDLYLDTRAGSLARAGLSGRCRHRGRRRTVEVKPVLLDPGAVLCRAEFVVDLAPGEDMGRAMRRLVEEHLPLRLRGVPIPELELRSRRQTWTLRTDGGLFAELCLDQVRVLGPGQRRGPVFVEVELEFFEGPSSDFDGLAQALLTLPGVKASGKSKHERARQLLGLPAIRPGLVPFRFEAQTPSGVVARGLGRSHWDAVRAFEGGTRVGLDAEYLHKMRVNTRRLRALVSAMAPCFEARGRVFLLRNLKWLAGLLGQVRDLDVQRLALPERQAATGPVPEEGWAELERVLRAQHESARRTLLAALDSPRYARLCERALALFAEPASSPRPGHPSSQPVVLLSGALIDRRARQVLKAARRASADPTPELAHALRIRGKKLRYLAEFFAPLHSDDFRRCTELFFGFQDILGQLNDRVVAGRALGVLRDQALASGAPGAYLYILGKLEAESLFAAQNARGEVARAFEALGGRKTIRSLAREAARTARASMEQDITGKSGVSVLSGEQADPGDSMVPPDQPSRLRSASKKRLSRAAQSSARTPRVTVRR